MIYRTFAKEQLDEILSRHKDWLADSSKGARADLRCANLRYADLRCADLRCANLRCANLRYADLRCADLRCADLRSADLRSADLRSANLLIFQFNRHTAYFTFDGTMMIGCECMPISEWIVGFEEIGKAHRYTTQEIKAYGQFIKMCAELFEEKTK